MKKALYLTFAMLGTAIPAHAEMPVFSAECPQQNYIDADRTGTVRVNGAVASVKMFNENYYEARHDGITYTISTQADGSELLVGYDPPGSAGGFCTIVSSAPARAQSTDFMLNECSSVAQTYFRDFTAQTDMKYNGQRTDGTHAINGRIYLETRFEDFACSYERDGRRMVEFFAEGRLQNAYLPGGVGDGSANAPDIVQVTGVPANDVLNVRGGPGTGFRIVGALSDGDSVRNLGCQAQDGSRWCQIEMMTDMRERGWVNARYLGGGTASQLPAEGTTATERVKFAPGTSGAELSGTLTPGSSKRYVLGARNGQLLYVRVVPRGSAISYQIFNPDNSFLLDLISSDREYRGQLWQSGDHVIEVINRTNRNAFYNVIFGID